MTPGDASVDDRSKNPGCRRLWITGAMLLGGLLLTEVLLRLFAAEPSLLRLDQLGGQLDGEKQQMTKIIDYDEEVFWRFQPDLEIARGEGPLFGRISNSQGLREPGPIPVPKPKDEIRILFLGDSCTFGYLLEQHETYVKLLENRLRRQFPKRRIRCINGGVPGYTVFQCWRLLVTRGLDFEPDLVIVQGGWNGSIVWDGRSDAEHYRAHRAATPPGPLAQSRLARLIWVNLFWPGPGEDGRARLAPSEMRRVLERMETACQERGAELLVLLTGSRTNVRNEALTALQAAQMEFASSRQFSGTGTPPFVDGVTPLRRLVARGIAIDRLLFDDAHPTKIFNDAIADALAQKITPWIARK